MKVGEEKRGEVFISSSKIQNSAEGVIWKELQPLLEHDRSSPNSFIV